MVADNLFSDSYPYSPLPVIVPVNGSTNITLQPSGCDTPLTAAVTRNPAHGSLTPLNNDQTIYTPGNNYSGPDSFEFQVSDACGEAARFIVPITVGVGAAGVFTLVTSNLDYNHLNGMDYSPTENALIVSEYGDSDYGGDNFLQLTTNSNGALAVTNFSGVSGLPDEVKLATEKENTNGFDEGDVYFGNNNNADVGWISADGSQSNLNWSILTNNAVTNTMHIRGGLYVDQTGVFSNDLIALASDGHAAPEVWLVNSNGSPTLLAQIPTQIEAGSGDILEGVISLPDNTNQWGPWAGKILTGDEDYGILYTIDTNGTVTPYDLGIASDDFNIIPTNEDLYVCDYDNSRMLKLSRSLFSNYVGDQLITQEGGVGSIPAELFVVNWDGTNFISREINVSAYAGESEDAIFAPLNLPSQPMQ